MKKFNLFFHSNTLPQTFEEGEKELAMLKAWGESFEKYVVNPGSVLKQSLIVTADDVQEVPPGETLSAFAEIQAKNASEAIELAKSWPILENGYVMISEVVDMDLD